MISRDVRRRCTYQMRSHLAIAALLIAGIEVPSPALGCSCGALDAVEAKRSSDLVFVGTVKSVSLRPGWLVGGDGSHRTRFRVSKVFKGDFEDGEDVVLVGDRHPDTCGFPFEAERTYVVYGLRREGKLLVHPCAWAFPTRVEESTLRWLRAKPIEVFRAQEDAV